MSLRILILSVGAGAGHIRAAQALEAAFCERCPSGDVLNVDAVRYTNPAFRKAFTDGYEKLVTDLPSIWGMIYESLEEQSSAGKLKKFVALFDRLNAQPLRRMVKEYGPDAIVCTHFLPAEVLGPRRLRGKLRAPLFIVLTDYDVHAMWVQPGVDRYFVPTEEARHALQMSGVGDMRVDVTGIPIMPVFAHDPPGRPSMRKKLGLDLDSPTVLVAAGGMGLMPVDQVVRVLATRLPQVQFLVVAGRNKRLFKRIQKAAEESPGKVFPFAFVENMDELMAASDLAVAKSGGLTTSECLAMRLPMVVYNAIPGQEERNAVYLLEKGAGVWAHTAAHMFFKVEYLLSHPEELERMRAAAERIRRPRAAYDIADIVLESVALRDHRTDRSDASTSA